MILPFLGTVSKGKVPQTQSKSIFPRGQYDILHALHSPVPPPPYISTNPSQKIHATRINERKMLWEKILKCESGNSHRNIFGKVKCNGQFGCKGGIGICQLIPSTVRTCERRMGKNINPFDKEENLECGRFLFKNDGWRHWGTPDANWGSYDCFKNYIKYY